MGCDVLFQMPHLKDDEAAFRGNHDDVRIQDISFVDANVRAT